MTVCSFHFNSNRISHSDAYRHFWRGQKVNSRHWNLAHHRYRQTMYLHFLKSYILSFDFIEIGLSALHGVSVRPWFQYYAAVARSRTVTDPRHHPPPTQNWPTLQRGFSASAELLVQTLKTETRRDETRRDETRRSKKRLETASRPRRSRPRLPGQSETWNTLFIWGIHYMCFHAWLSVSIRYCY